MKKFFPHFIIILSILLITASFLYFIDQGRVDSGKFPLSEEREISELLNPEVYENDYGEYLLSGYLRENRIEEDGYLTISVEMDRFFVGYPSEERDVKVLISKRLPVIEWNVETDEKTIIEYSDLEEGNDMLVFLTVTIDRIIEGVDLIAQNQLMKIIGGGDNGSNGAETGEANN